MAYVQVEFSIPNDRSSGSVRMLMDMNLIDCALQIEEVVGTYVLLLFDEACYQSLISILIVIFYFLVSSILFLFLIDRHSAPFSSDLLVFSSTLKFYSTYLDHQEPKSFSCLIPSHLTCLSSFLSILVTHSFSFSLSLSIDL